VAALAAQGTRHWLGREDAPLVIVEFGDFRCPYCGQFAQETFPRLRDEWIAAGRARFGYRHLAFLGPESTQAAIASECAAAQGAFWAYHDALYARQAEGFSPETLRRLAGDAGLDADAFATCLQQGDANEQVEADIALAETLGITGTPAFLVDGYLLSGAMPFETFRSVLEALQEND